MSLKIIYYEFVFPRDPLKLWALSKLQNIVQNLFRLKISRLPSIFHIVNVYRNYIILLNLVLIGGVHLENNF